MTMSNKTAGEINRRTGETLGVGTKIQVLEGLTAAPLSNAAPLALGVADKGVAVTASRADHVHAHGDLSAIPTDLHTGSQVAFARADGSKVAVKAASDTVETALVDLDIANGRTPAEQFGSRGTFKALFDATAGKIVGDHLFGPVLPDKMFVTRARIQIKTTFQTAGADAGTIAVGIGTDAADGLVTAVAVNDGANPWDAAAGAFRDTKCVDTAATFAGPTTTATRQLIVVVGGQALTAGVMYVHCDYLIGN